MAIELWTTDELYGVFEDNRLSRPTSFWRDTFFPNTYTSEEEEIKFVNLSTTRMIAPFVLPSDTGKPIFKDRGESVKAFKPGYIKVKDTVRPHEALSPRPSELGSNRGRFLTPAQRFDAKVAQIQLQHRDSIIRQWDRMAAEAILTGKVTIDYARDEGVNNPSVLLDFGRAAGHTVTVGSGAYWSDPDLDIFDVVQGWIDTMATAAFGGAPTKMIVGASVVPYLRKNKAILANLDLTRRGGDADIRTGLVGYDANSPLSYIGTLGAGLEIWRYSDFWVHPTTGASIPIMNPKDVLLAAPGVDGIQGFGAIVDKAAGLRAMDIFPKMWDQEDPSATFIMNQSAPLMIPVNPNRTFKARVLA